MRMSIISTSDKGECWTHITPAADYVQHIPAAHREINNATVDGLRGALGSEVLLGNLHPPKGANGEPDGPSIGALADVTSGWVAPASGGQDRGMVMVVLYGNSIMTASIHSTISFISLFIKSVIKAFNFSMTIILGIHWSKENTHL